MPSTFQRNRNKGSSWLRHVTFNVFSKDWEICVPEHTEYARSFFHIWHECSRCSPDASARQHVGALAKSSFQYVWVLNRVWSLYDCIVCSVCCLDLYARKKSRLHKIFFFFLKRNLTFWCHQPSTLKGALWSFGEDVSKRHFYTLANQINNLFVFMTE